MEKKYAKQIADKDNVATCLADVVKGDTVTVKFGGTETAYTAREDISFGHKIGIQEVAVGEYVYKYGQKIGKAIKPIRIGDWVHTHNVVDHYEVI